MIIHYIATGFGGALGAILRLSLSKIFPHTLCGFPISILFINIMGCLIMGLLTEIMASYWTPSNTMRYFLITGLLGGFTTFSSFSLEFGLLIEQNELTLAITYAALSVVLCLLFFFVGMKIVRLF